MTKAVFATLLFAVPVLHAQPPRPVSQQAAETVMHVFPQGTGDVWNYEEGTMLEGMDGAWYATANGEYFRYIQRCVDRFVSDDGSIRSYDPGQFSLDLILMGRQLILLYEVTGQEKYYKAASLLYDQLKHQPRTAAGGFWHKQRYPDQMWLDSLYMAEPFYAEYASRFHHPEDFGDIETQFQLLEAHARDPKTGLLYHGWDESKQQCWANKTTGDSPSFWSRGMGWYAMALADVLDYLPVDDPAHAKMVARLNRFAKGIVAAQGKDGLWWQIADNPGRAGNYEESSASAMFVYALEKGVRKGYLPESYRGAAEKGYAAILKKFVTTDVQGLLRLTGTADAVGLGDGPPYRDGSYSHYTSVRQVDNDARGLGALLLASNEMEMLPTLGLGKGKTVLLDSWFNAERRKDITGTLIPYHYKWEEMDNNGLSFFAHAFEADGVKTRTLYNAPTAKDLAGVSVYIITDPNFKTTPANPHYNPHPSFITPSDAAVISEWVRNGGTLLLFANDKLNSEFDHLNTLAEIFGITFHKDTRNYVTGSNFDMGRSVLRSAGPVFTDGLNVFMKEICTLGTTPPAQPLFLDNGDTLIAIAHFGKGRIFAVGDPWFYNEYTDGRKLPDRFQNYKAARDLVRWSVERSR